MKVSCHYCGKDAEKVTGEKIYPHRKDLHRLKYWYCECQEGGAYVGCHQPKHMNDEPFGILANPNLRRLKSSVHKAFDPLWKKGEWSRKEAYRWLGKVMNLDREKVHIGMFNEGLCMNALNEIKALEAE